jgi:hypothetical protein
MKKKFIITVSRVCCQSKDFEVEAPSLKLAEERAIDNACDFDWSDITTTDVDYEIIDGFEIEREPERQVTIIFGEMVFEEEDYHTCKIEVEQMRVQASISKAEEFAENIISEGLYVSYVIPELYDGRII